MYNKPITQKAKSPLKQTKDEPGKITVDNKEIIKGTPPSAGNLVRTIEYTGAKDPGVYDALQKELNSGFAKRKYGFEGTDVKAYEQMKLGRMKNNVKVTTTGTPGTPGTPDREEVTSKDIYTKDKTDAITPYAAYQNRIVERREGGNLKRNARKALNSKARDYAYETGDGEDAGIIERFTSNRKQMRDYKKGMAEGMSDEDKKEARYLRQTKRGANALQTDLTEAELALKRARDQRAQGASGDDDVISNPRLANSTDILNADVQGQIANTEGDVNINSPAEMRYNQNVGIKKSSPMKKGYFKGK
jgi:hypothetical protein